MKKKLVSIVLATNNGAKYINAAISSVLVQTFSDFELIIIDDSSRDDTPEIITRLSQQDSRIKIITNKTKKGLTKSLNIGINQSKGEYIARIDSDDIWSDQTKLEKQILFLEKNPEIGMVGCWGKTIAADKRILGKLQYPIYDIDIRKYILIENCFIHSSVLIRRSLIKDLSGYNEQYHFAQDYDLWLRIGEKAKLYNLPSFMVLYRKNPSGISSQNYKQQIYETIHSVKSHRDSYRYSHLSLLLWNLRLFIPVWIRETFSQFLRSQLFNSSFKTNLNK